MTKLRAALARFLRWFSSGRPAPVVDAARYDDGSTWGGGKTWGGTTHRDPEP